MNPTLESALQRLLDDSASQEDVTLLRQALLGGKVTIGGNVEHSIIIIGSGNAVELSPRALESLDGYSLLGGLNRDLTGDEIALGLTRLAELIPVYAPCLQPSLTLLGQRLRPLLQTVADTLSVYARKERTETLAALNGLSLEVLDISFNALCLGKSPPTYDVRCPFRGLESFRPQDAEFFFGREPLVERLVARLSRHPFLAVLGASGCGKSSLVMAGLLPALGLDYAIFRPGADPLAELELALRAEPGLIVVDQFEELFTLSAQEQRPEFVARLLEQASKRRVVVVMRVDFLGEVTSFVALKDRVQEYQEIIPPMTKDELRCAVEGQAGRVGLRFEADLCEQMLDDVSDEPGAMPLLQHALWELWKRRHGFWLKADEYRAFGGVRQAIARTAEDVYEHCSPQEQSRIRDIFIRLTRLDERTGGRDTRRRVRLSELVPVGDDPTATMVLLDKLADARLLVKTETLAEVAHEALIQHWARLRSWLDDDRETLRLRETLGEESLRWEQAGRDEVMLNHRGSRLARALDLEKVGFNLLERAYLDACATREASELAQKQEQERRETLLREEKLRAEVVATQSKLRLARRNFVLVCLALLTALLLAAPTVYEQFLRWQARNDVEMVLLRAGPAQLGNEFDSRDGRALKPGVYQVAAFKIEKFEVTNQRYKKCVDAGKCSPPNADQPNYDENPNRPVANVSFLQAYQFCTWIGRSLPSDAQWERAARSMDGRMWPWGDEKPVSGEYAALDFSGSCFSKLDTCVFQDVGQAGLGISDDEPVFDLIGNVAEWTCTPYDAASPNDCWVYGSESAFPKNLSLRGFGAHIPLEFASAYGAYYRESASPTYTGNFVGFRCVETVQP